MFKSSVVNVVCVMAVYIAEDLPDDSDTQYITPEQPQSAPTLQPGGDLLARSLQQLQEGLDSGTVMTQFEVRNHYNSYRRDWTAALS